MDREQQSAESPGDLFKNSYHPISILSRGSEGDRLIIRRGGYGSAPQAEHYKRNNRPLLSKIKIDFPVGDLSSWGTPGTDLRDSKERI